MKDSLNKAGCGSPNDATRQAKISDNQSRLFEEIWVETVRRVIPITDVDQIATEWLALSNMFERYKIEAYDRYKLHAK